MLNHRPQATSRAAAALCPEGCLQVYVVWQLLTQCLRGLCSVVVPVTANRDGADESVEYCKIDFPFVCTQPGSASDNFCSLGDPLLGMAVYRRSLAVVTAGIHKDTFACARETSERIHRRTISR